MHTETYAELEERLKREELARKTSMNRAERRAEQKMTKDMKHSLGKRITK